MLLELGPLFSFWVCDELTRLDLYLRLLADPPPIVYGVYLLVFRIIRAQMLKHDCLMRHLPMPDAEPQGELLIII